ncbi:MAG TPA: decarboxylating 6-phosphogluconate dehydrogenase [Acidimicrobiales bacterium]|jgi:6-phosphogluconate dehydrogenase|nr:decarboxylating 6-phosphogluconate dehydrogenase [Acidimicrobiales bacterium]
MHVGMVGLGRMGANMSLRLVGHGHDVLGYDLGAPARQALEAKGVPTVASLAELAARLPRPRLVWVMVPAGQPTDDTVAALADLLEAGDVVVDGGNSNYKTAAAYAATLSARAIHFVDAGTSGGVWGLEEGYCLMVGGSDEAVALAEPVFRALAPEGGYAHVGPVGAGHFVKMVHNGIEYGLMQAYAEGFELMAAASEFDLDLHEIASIWRYGSVVRSWLLDLTEAALRPGAGFESIEGVVEDSGEGRWTVEEAVARGVPAPVITASLYRRFESRQRDSFGARLLAALRNQFGGHAVVRREAGQ